MAMVERLNEFDAKVRALGVALHAQVKREIGKKKWVCATLDVRFAQQGSSWLSKIRVTVPNSEMVSISVPADIQLILLDLNALRRASFSDEWYGLILEVNPQGNCTVSLNYNSQCAEDESFFDT